MSDGGVGSDFDVRISDFPQGVVMPDVNQIDQIAPHIAEILKRLGLDPDSDPALRRTPERVAQLYLELFQAVGQPPPDIGLIENPQPSGEMILIRDLPFYSMCVPSTEPISTPVGAVRVANVHPGQQLWTFDDDGALVTTTVVSVAWRRACELVEVEAGGRAIRVTPEHPLLTADGWRPAGSLGVGDKVRAMNPKRLDPIRRPVSEGYERRSVIEAVGRDGNADDDYKLKRPQGARWIIPANLPVLEELGQLLGTKPRPATPPGVGLLHVSRHGHKPGWYGHPGYRQEAVPLLPPDGQWTPVDRVSQIQAAGTTPFRVYSFECTPYPTFLVNGIQAHNCVHHLVPFFGRAHIAYVPKDKLAGFSGLARLLRHFASQPQLQERMTNAVADHLQAVLQPEGVIVHVQARQLCLEMRGERVPGLVETTAARRVFQSGPLREEFFARIKAAS
jgi:GTP cyclohydrolase I